jgi:hypothetical protein
VNLDDPIATALRVAEALERAGATYALFGGLLLAAYGDPRETRDVDLAVIDVAAAEAKRALEAAGLHSSISFEAVTFGGLSISRLALLGGDADTGLNRGAVAIGDSSPPRPHHPRAHGRRLRALQGSRDARPRPR